MSAAPITIGLGDFSGGETVLSFEGYADWTLITNQFALSGVTFDSATYGGWYMQAYSNYGATLASNASGLGLGVTAIMHYNDSEEILFTTAVTRVGFYFGSNVNINVPVTLYMNGSPTGNFNLSPLANEMTFVGWEDPAGIDRIVFADENLDLLAMSNLDGLRYEGSISSAVPEPSSFALVLGGIGALICFRRRTRR